MNFHLSNILALKIVVEISCLLCESIKVTALEGEGSQLTKQFLLSRRVPSEGLKETDGWKSILHFLL